MPPIKIQRLYERASSSKKSWNRYDNGCCVIGNDRRLQVAIGPDVLFADDIQRQQVAVFDDCQANGFQEPQCAKWLDEIQLQECRENKDVESDECKKYRTWVIADQELEDILKNAQNEE